MKKRVLFLCTANAARSQMAEALLRQHGANRFEAFSAGTQPGQVTSETLTTLAAFGVQHQRLVSKPLEQFVHQRFDYVITLCDKAHQECQQWPDSDTVLAWDFPDPQQGSTSYARTLSEINERIRLFVLIADRQDFSTTPIPPSLFSVDDIDMSPDASIR